MDFSKFDRVQEKLLLMVSYVNSLKEENRRLKRKIYSLEINLDQARASASIHTGGGANQHTNLAGELGQLKAERLVIRDKARKIMKQIDSLNLKRA